MLVKDTRAWQPLRDALDALEAVVFGVFLFVFFLGFVGDALIAAGTWQFFEDCQIAPRYSSTRDIVAGDTAIYSGGGNLVPEYDNCRDFLARCLQVGVARALVLPHSIRGHQDLLRRLDTRFTLVCRDLESLARVKATGTRTKEKNTPDKALYFDPERLFARCSRYG